MDNKYKALSYVPPKSINIKQRFGKLTLATCSSAEKTKPSGPATTASSFKKTLYTYVNPKNNDVKILDDSLITDDESDDDDGPSGSERNKIINNILNSDDKSDDDDHDGVKPEDNEPIRSTNQNHCDGEKSQFSAKLLLNDSDETNSILETEMEKLGIALNPSTPLQKKCSTPLFSTTSDTIISRLSSQMDRLGLNVISNLPDEIKTRNSVNDNSETPLTNVSILTISSTISDDSETEENTDDSDEDAESDVIILSSDEDVNNDKRGSSESELQKHVSSLTQATNDSLSTHVKQKLSDFFNNIPSPESPERSSSAKDRLEFIPETPEDHEIIPETPENLSLNDVPNLEQEPIINTDSSVAKINSQVAPNSNVSSEAEDTHVSVNISAKIQINIQISELEKTRCESTEPSEPEHEPDKLQQQFSNSPISERTNFQLEDVTNESIHDQISPERETNSNKFVGLNKTDVEIDEEMESILNELYGKAWQTPQLLEKCLSTKKKANKTTQKPTEQIDDTDFSLFGKKINDELESTRLPERVMSKTKRAKPVKKDKASTGKEKSLIVTKVPSKNPQNSSSDEEEPQHPERRRLDFGRVGLPKRQAALKSQLYRKVCDPDTSETESSCGNGSDSDLNFTINVNEVDDDSDDEIQKENRRDRRIGKVLDQYEYKKKPAIPGTPPLSYLLPATQKAGNSKRKLYTPGNFEIYLPETEVTPPPKPSCQESLQQISSWFTLKNKKIDEVKKCDLFVTPKSKDAATPKSSAKSKATVKSETYGFIQSLDDKTPKEYCHPDAIKYRDNYARTKYELADKLYDLYNAQIFNFAEKVEVSWNKKLLTTAGRCLTKRKNNVRSCRIELSEKVLTTAGRLRCTLVHELCHAATWLYDGDNGHGPRWKAWASKSMSVFPDLPKIGVCHAYDIEYKYTYMCTQCNAKQQAHSKAMKVENKCCKYCHGKIEVFLNKKNRDGEIVRTPIRPVTGFAKFVQENYKFHKTDGVKHADVMKILGSKFREMGASEL